MNRHFIYIVYLISHKPLQVRYYHPYLANEEFEDLQSWNTLLGSAASHERGGASPAEDGALCTW